MYFCTVKKNTNQPIKEDTTMNKTWNGISWNTEDLLNCKNAARIIAREFGWWIAVKLDFGNLDTWAVLQEEGYIEEK